MRLCVFGIRRAGFLSCKHRITDGVIQIDSKDLPDGTTVTLLAHESDETFELDKTVVPTSSRRSSFLITSTGAMKPSTVNPVFIATRKLRETASGRSN